MTCTEAYFVGIDIGSRTNVISALNFDQDFLIRMVPVANAQGGAEQMEEMVAQVLSQHHEFRTVIIGLESTGFYGVHIANYLSTSEKLAPFSTKAYCLNPNEVKQYKKSFNSLDKNDGIDSFVIAEPQPLFCHMPLDTLYAAGCPIVIEGTAYFDGAIPPF